MNERDVIDWCMMQEREREREREKRSLPMQKPTLVFNSGSFQWKHTMIKKKNTNIKVGRKWKLAPIYVKVVVGVRGRQQKKTGKKTLSS